MTTYAELIANPDLPRAWLVAAEPYDPAASALTQVGFSSGLTFPVLDGRFWPARLGSVLNTQIDLFSQGVSGGSQPGFGEITVAIGEDAYHSLTRLHWDGRKIAVLMGPPDGPFSEFQPVFNGTAKAIRYSGGVLSIVLRDFGHRLDKPLQADLFGGTGGLDGSADVKGRPIPLAFGQCVNVPALLIDPVKWVFRVHERALQAITAVFDRSLPLLAAGDVADVWAWTPVAGQYVTSLANGVFRLGAPADGPVTCDLRGDAEGGYVETAVDVLERIATWKGGLLSADLDAAALAAADALRPWPVGLYAADEMRAYAALDQLVQSIGGWWTWTPTGLLTAGIVGIDPPTLTLTADDYSDLSLEDDPPPVWRRKVGYRRSWLVQTLEEQDRPVARDTEFVGGVPAQDVADAVAQIGGGPTTPPGAPGVPFLSTAVEVSESGAVVVRLYATWGAPPAEPGDVTQDGELVTVGGETVTYLGIVGAGDVTEGGVTVTHQGATVTYGGVVSSDVTFYEVEIAEGFGSFIGYTTPSTGFQWIVKANTDYRVRVRAVDRHGNRSPWSGIATLTAGRDSDPPPAQTSLTVRVGFREVWLETEPSAASDIGHYEFRESPGNNRDYVSAVTLRSPAPVLARTGLLSGETRWYWVRAVDTSGNAGPWHPASPGAGIEATTVKVDSTDIIEAAAVITNSAQIGSAIISDAHVASLSAAKLTAGTALASSLTVDGRMLGTIGANAADPAGVVNAGVTKILPGLIEIDGGTTLASWRDGTDATKINGGAIAANSIATNKLTVGARGLTIEGIEFEPNWTATPSLLRWTAGTIGHVGDDGSPALTAVAGGQYQWSTGTAYIYWARGAAALAITTSPAQAFQADRVVLATYRGGVDLIAFYGRTIIDGSQIKTGTVQADRIESGAVFTQTVFLGSNADGAGLALDGTTGRIRGTFDNGATAFELGRNGGDLLRFFQPNGQPALWLDNVGLGLGDGLVVTDNIAANAITSVQTATIAAFSASSGLQDFTGTRDLITVTTDPAGGGELLLMLSPLEHPGFQTITAATGLVRDPEIGDFLTYSSWRVETPARVVYLATTGGGSGQNLTLRLERVIGGVPTTITNFYASALSGGLSGAIPALTIWDKPGPGVTATYRAYYKTYNDSGPGRSNVFRVYTSNAIAMEIKR